MEHITSQCSRPNTDPPKCVNCGGAHTANNITCVIYQKKLAAVQNNSVRVPPPPQMKYVAAPMPVRNAWQNRSQQAPPKQDNHNFPPLPQRRTGVLSQQVPTQQPVNETTQLPAVTTRNNSDLAKFQAVKAEFEKMRTMIDLDLVLQQVRDLNELLAQCNSPSDRFTVFYNFLGSLDAC